MGIALALAFTLFWIPIFIFRVEDRSESMPHYAGAERFWVNAAPLVLSLHSTVSCVAMIRHVPAGGRAVIALILLAGAAGFWFWGRSQIGPLRRTRTPDEPVLRLCRDGAFGVVRHPLYFALLVHSLGLLVAAGTMGSLATFAMASTVIAVRSVQEERRLRAQLGEAYAYYAERVARLLPFLW